MATVVIGADICPIEGNRPYFEKGDARSLFGDLLPEFTSAQLVIANLECPLIEKSTPIPKTGPAFGESSGCVKGIKQAGIDVLCLANNHILDHGASGLMNTLNVCAEAGISTVGAGENLQAARRILVREVEGIRVGILAMAEHEFSIATKNSAGANPLNLIDYVRNVSGRRGEFDYLIVLLHGSDEFFVPTPRIKDTCRFMIEAGANAVIVQHPHVLGGYEEYRGGHIVYGQGALIMDEAIYRAVKSFHEGFLVRLSIARGSGPASMELVPFAQSDPVPGARRMEGERERELRQRLQEKSRTVQNDADLEAAWLSFCQRRKHGYLSGLLGHNRVVARLNASGWIERVLHSKRALLRAKNIVCCETHREAVETLFNGDLI